MATLLHSMESGAHGASERSPLLGRSCTGEIAHKGSVYTYMIFTPPLARYESGHYLTPSVGLAFSLMVLSVFLQVSLTVIAGNDILRQQEHAKLTLIREAEPRDTDYLRLIHDDLAIMAKHGLAVRAKISEPLDKAIAHIKTEKGLKEEVVAVQKCCAEAACFGYNLACCASSGRKLRDTASASGFVTMDSHDDYVRSMPRPNSSVAEGPSFIQSILEKKPGGGGGGGKSGHARHDRYDDEDEDGAGPPPVEPLCVDIDGVIICMPPSFAIVEDWQDLDSNGDGVWTLDEAKEDMSNLGCRTGTILEDVFRAACRGLRQFAANTEGMSMRSLPPGLLNLQAIPRSYYELWRGFFAVCINTDSHMCGSLITQGVFDGALDPSPHNQSWTKPFGGIRDLDTAMAYCQRLLTPGGICDAALPGRYLMYRHRVEDTCGVPMLHDGPRYSNPHNSHDTMGFMLVSWSKHDEFEITHSWSFQVFMGLILAVWYINMVDEIKEIINLWDFIANFRVLEEWPFTPRPGFKSLGGTQLDNEELDDEEIDAENEGDAVMPSKTYIDSIARPHKYTVVCMAIVRSIVVWYLGYAGTIFLLSNHSFIDLLLNALAMAFLFELDEFLYFFLVPESHKRKLEALDSLKFKSSIPSTGYSALLFSKHVWGLIVIPVICISVVYWNDQMRTLPMLKALECACMKQGETCLAPAMFTHDWWDQYWKELAHWRLQEHEVWGSG